MPPSRHYFCAEQLASCMIVATPAVAAITTCQPAELPLLAGMPAPAPASCCRCATLAPAYAASDAIGQLLMLAGCQRPCQLDKPQTQPILHQLQRFVAAAASHASTVIDYSFWRISAEIHCSQSFISFIDYRRQPILSLYERHRSR